MLEGASRFLHTVQSNCEGNNCGYKQKIKEWVFDGRSGVRRGLDRAMGLPCRSHHIGHSDIIRPRLGLHSAFGKPWAKEVFLLSILGGGQARKLELWQLLKCMALSVSGLICRHLRQVSTLALTKVVLGLNEYELTRSATSATR